MKTRPAGDQLKFQSAATGEHVIDTYLEASEKGGRTLPDLLDDLFTGSGTIRTDLFEWRVSNNQLQTRTGDYVDPETGWVNVENYFANRGVFSTGATYSNLDVVQVSDNSVYLANLTAPTQYASEAAFEAAGHTKLIDIAQLNAAVANAQAAQSAAEAAEGNAAASETTATNKAGEAAADAAQTAADRIAVAADAAQVAADKAAVASDKSATETAKTASEAAQAASEAALDSFDDRYLGSKASAPTLDNDGNALLEGALYWNSASKDMWVYNGAAWEAIELSAADILARLSTVDGPGSGLDADTVDGVGLAGLVQRPQIISDATDLDAIADGFYAWNGSAPANAPTTYAMCLAFSDGVRQHQLAWGSTSGRIWVRRNNSGTWAAWTNIWTNSNDGAGTGLDADKLDGQHGSFYQNAANLNAGTIPQARIAASDILTLMQTVDGASSGLDADLLDGYEASAFARLNTSPTFTGLTLTGWMTSTTGMNVSNDCWIETDDTSRHTRFIVKRADTGVTAWFGIPSWDLDGLYIYGPTATGSHTAAKYTNGTWSLYSDGLERLKILSSGRTQILSGVTINGTADGTAVATAAEYRNNTADKLLSVDQVWSAMAEVTLSDAATISWNMDNGIDFKVTLGGNRTLANPTNVQVGKKGRLRVLQDGTGSRTLSFGANFKFANGTAPTLTTTASAADVLFYDCVSATEIIVSALGDVK